MVGVKMEWGYDEIRAPPYQGKVLASPPVKMPNRIPWKAISDALVLVFRTFLRIPTLP